MRKLIMIAAAAASLACDGSRTETMKQLAQMQEISAQKDSLLKEVTATTAFVAELGRQVSSVRNLKAGRDVAGNVTDLEDSMSPDQRRTRLMDQVREITERVNLAENRLAVSRKRVAELTGSDAEKSKRLAEFDSTIVSFRGIMESQKIQLASLSQQVDALTTENTQLKASNVQLTSRSETAESSRDSLQTDRNMVFYVVSTEKALVNSHVLQKEGGFLGLGKTPVPVRDLDRNQFTQIDRTRVSEIPLPDPGKSYKIVTRQDLAAVEVPPDAKGRFTGSIRIKDPETFWKASKYLIVIEQ